MWKTSLLLQVLRSWVLFLTRLWTALFVNLNQPLRHEEANVRHHGMKKVEDFSAFRFVSCQCLVQYEIPESEGHVWRVRISFSGSCWNGYDCYFHSTRSHGGKRGLLEMTMLSPAKQPSHLAGGLGTRPELTGASCKSSTANPPVSCLATRMETALTLQASPAAAFPLQPDSSTSRGPSLWEQEPGNTGHPFFENQGLRDPNNVGLWWFIGAKPWRKIPVKGLNTCSVSHCNNTMSKVASVWSSPEQTAIMGSGRKESLCIYLSESGSHWRNFLTPPQMIGYAFLELVSA